MANLSIPKRSLVAGSLPTASDLWHDIHLLTGISATRLPLTGFFVHPTLVGQTIRRFVYVDSAS